MRYWLLFLLCLLGCSAEPAFNPEEHPKSVLKLVTPEGETQNLTLKALHTGATSRLEYHDHHFGGNRTYEGIDLERLLSFYTGSKEVVSLKFHCRDGFISEVSRETLSQGKFLLAYRDVGAAPAAFVPAEKLAFLVEEPKRLQKKLDSSQLTQEQREKIEQERDHLSTLAKDFAQLGDQGPFYPIFLAPDLPKGKGWNPPFAVEQVSLLANPSDKSAALPKGLPEQHPAMVGAKLFQRHCTHCHAVNGVGGQVGPELNQPMSVTSYWTEEGLRKMLYDPKQVRNNSKMPALRLKGEAVDQLLAYLRWMDQNRDTKEEDAGESPD